MLTESRKMRENTSRHPTMFFKEKSVKSVFFYKKSYKSSKVKSQKLYNSLLF